MNSALPKEKQLDTYRVLSKMFKYFLFGISLSLASQMAIKAPLKMDESLCIAIYASIIYAVFDLNNESPSSFC